VYYARNSHQNEFIDFLPHTYSCAFLALLLMLCVISLMDLTITHMVLVQERVALCLDALVSTHFLIVVLIPRVGTVLLLEVSILTLSPDTWTVHIFPVMVHVPLDQMVRC
jgi:hypothetical protein